MRGRAGPGRSSRNRKASTNHATDGVCVQGRVAALPASQTVLRQAGLDAVRGRTASDSEAASVARQAAANNMAGRAQGLQGQVVCAAVGRCSTRGYQAQATEHFRVIRVALQLRRTEHPCSPALSSAGLQQAGAQLPGLLHSQQGSTLQESALPESQSS